MSQDTFARVRKIVIEQLISDADKVTPEARFRDELEADSLDLVELVMALEEEFGFEISEEDAQKIVTVRDAAEYIERRLREKG